MQKKYSFDKESLKKILKGGMIAASGAGSLAFLNYIGTVEIDDPILASVVALLVPTLVNLIKEFIKGE